MGILGTVYHICHVMLRLLPPAIAWLAIVVLPHRAETASCYESDLLQMMQRLKGVSGVRDQCSAKDDENLNSMELHLKAMSNWAIAEDVKSAMEMVTGELEAEYEKIVEDHITITVGQGWTDRLVSVAKSVTEDIAGIWKDKSEFESNLQVFFSESGAPQTWCSFLFVNITRREQQGD